MAIPAAVISSTPQAGPVELQPLPAQATPNAPPLAQPLLGQQAGATQQQMMSLQVLVREGANAGQRVEFTTPDGQKMTILSPDRIEPNSVVTVQYALSQPYVNSNQVAQMPQGPAVAPMMPQPQAYTQMQMDDSNGSVVTWCLYGIGWLCCCICPLCGPLLWTIAACMFFCKPQPHRAQLVRQKTPAYVALLTCIGVAVIGLVAAIICAIVAMHSHGHFHLHGKGHGFPFHHHHHHGVPGSPNATLHSDYEPVWASGRQVDHIFT